MSSARPLGEPNGPGARIELDLGEGRTLEAVLWLPRPARTIVLGDGSSVDRHGRGHAAAVDVFVLDPELPDDRGEPGARTVSSEYRDGDLDVVLGLLGPELGEELLRVARSDEESRP